VPNTRSTEKAHRSAVHRRKAVDEIGTPPRFLAGKQDYAISQAHKLSMVARCSCGSVELEALGVPITSAVCYCDTCQEGSRQLEALPNAARVRDADGGTAYILFRTDRVRYLRGDHLLRNLKLSESTATLRVFASCCNSAMVMKFDDARHWVSVYRARVGGDIPPLQFRICTKFRPANSKVPSDVPSSAMYPFGLLAKLATAKIAMLLRLR
jgi:hypothetical protein